MPTLCLEFVSNYLSYYELVHICMTILEFVGMLKTIKLIIYGGL